MSSTPGSTSMPAQTTAWVPALQWLRAYKPAMLRADIIAGITLAAYVLPAAIGDASLARLSPEAGLYACMFGGLVFWAFCGSRHTAVSVTSAISLLIGISLGPIAGGDASRFGALAACAALMVGAMYFLAWLLKAGSLVAFVSETVLIGFKIGVAFTLASTQLPKLFGFSAAHGNFWHCAEHFFANLHETNRTALATGLSALAVLILGKLFLPNKPVALFVVVGGIIASSVLGLGARGVKVLGEVPHGLPPINVPAVSLSDLNELLPLALACFLLGAVESAAIGRMFAAKHGSRFNANQEFLALAGANLAAGLGRGFPISGGMSQSLVNESAGARTPISGLFSATLILIIAVFFSGLLHDLPQPVLAAVILMAVTSLVNVSALRHLWRTDRTEFAIAAIALAGVLTSGLLRGVLIGVIISIVLLIRRAARPHVAFLGQIPGTRRYSDLERHPDNQPVPGVLIFRSEGSIVYFNADHVRETVLQRVAESSPRPTVVICDLSAAPILDSAGAHMLRTLDNDLWAQGIVLHIVEARSAVRDRLRTEGFENREGRIDRFTSVADAVESRQAAPVK